MSRRPRIVPPPVTSAHGFAGDVPDYARTRADARRQRAGSAPLTDGEEGGGSVFSEFDNVTVEVEGFSTPPQLPAVPQGQQGHNSAALSPAVSVGSNLSDLLHGSDNEDHSSVDGSGPAGGNAPPLPIPAPDILPAVSSDSDDDDIMAQTFKFTYEDDLLETCRLASIEASKYQCSKEENFPQRAHKMAMRSALYAALPSWAQERMALVGPIVAQQDG